MWLWWPSECPEDQWPGGQESIPSWQGLPPGHAWAALLPTRLCPGGVCCSSGCLVGRLLPAGLSVIVQRFTSLSLRLAA